MTLRMAGVVFPARTAPSKLTYRLGAVSSAAAALRSKGFEIGPFVGISFSMTGSIRAFEEYFGTQIRLGRDRGYEFVIKNTSLGHELSGERLPEAIRHLVQTVAFPLPPGFGPAEFRG